MRLWPRHTRRWQPRSWWGALLLGRPPRGEYEALWSYVRDQVPDLHTAHVFLDAGRRLHVNVHTGDADERVDLVHRTADRFDATVTTRDTGWRVTHRATLNLGGHTVIVSTAVQPH